MVTADTQASEPCSHLLALDHAPVVKSNSSGGGLGLRLVQLPLPQLSSHGEAKDPVLTSPLAPPIMLESTCPSYQTVHLTAETAAQQPKGQPSSRMPLAPTQPAVPQGAEPDTLTCKTPVRGRQGRLARRVGHAPRRGSRLPAASLALLYLIASKSDLPAGGTPPCPDNLSIHFEGEH